MRKVSVITVCYNAEIDLGRTIESVLKQTYNNFEYIVIDGGSIDNSVELLEKSKMKFVLKGIPFTYISEKDRGTYDAMNKGINMAIGEWINYINAGDCFYSDTTLEDFFSSDISDETGVCYGNTLQIYDFGCGISQPKDFKNNFVMPFIHQSSFVRKELLRKYRFDLKFKIVADFDFFFRLKRDEIAFQYIPQTVSRYNGQYGLSATNPLLLHKELLEIKGITQRWYYGWVLAWTYLRYGWVQFFKDHIPCFVTNAWMKSKRKYIK